MNHTTIEWALNPDGSPGYTWNPITGCLNHIDGLCKGGGFPCYAYKLANTRLKQRYYANKSLPDDALLGRIYDDPFYPRFWEERVLDLTTHRIRHHARDRRGVFVCDMGDLFGIGVPEKWTERVLDAVKYHPYDRFYLLTKQPQNLIKFSPFPNNAWIGATATNTDMLLNAINCLEEVKAQVKYISLEPFLSWGDTSKWVYPLSDSLKGLSWIIIGACSGSLADLQKLHQRYPELALRDNKKFTSFVALPKLEWIREIIEGADKGGIPVFLKDNLVPWLSSEFEVAHAWAYEHGAYRQEMPHGDE